MKIISIALVALVTSCSGGGIVDTNNTINTANAANKVYAAKTGYQIVLIAAVNYNKLPRCTPTSTPVCSSAAVVDQLRKANAAALATLDSAEDVVRTPNVNQDVVQFSVLAAENAVKTVQSIVVTYKIK